MMFSLGPLSRLSSQGDEVPAPRTFSARRFATNVAGRPRCAPELRESSLGQIV